MRSRNRRWQWVGVATALVFVAMGSAQAGLVDTFDPPNPAVTAT